MAKKDNFSWMQDATKELESTFSSFDAATADLLVLKWNGEYEIRFLPLTEDQIHDYFRPVGFHWNLVADTEEFARPVACPRFTKRVFNSDDGFTILKDQECPVCDSINTLIAEGKATARDFRGQDSVALRKVYFIRGILIGFDPKPGQKNIPEFKDLPMQKIIQIPVSLAKKIKAKIDSKHLGGPATFFDPDHGKRILISRIDDGQVSYEFDILDEDPIPEEFREVEDYIPIDRTIPGDTADSIRQIMSENRHEYPELAKIALSETVKVLPASDGADDIDDQLNNL
jgi:hypothetical protein